jgi:2,3-bisphosphoglycerate-independent phosphoglycerate mutase
MADTLKTRDSIQRQKTRPVVLVIMDGWGYSESPTDNAIAAADTPNFSRLWSTCPHALLRTSGLDVGLPEGQMGNSEVGHLHIGAGRLVMQDLPLIDRAAASGELGRAPALRRFIETLRQTGGACHLLGLASPGGVHSHQSHAAALANVLTEAGLSVIVHAITDGRDTPPRSAAGYLEELTKALPRPARFGTVCGRYYAMDRDNRWDRVAKAYGAIVEGEGARFATPCDAVKDAYAQDITDEFVTPTVIGDYRGIQDGDGLLCFNFRADRVREILASILDPEFASFPRRRTVRVASALGMTQYSEKLDLFLQTIFPPRALRHVLGEVVSAAGRRQLRIAETEKYAHVTYFLNGGEETPYPGEDRVLVPSPKVATYDAKPEMSAPEVTDKVVEAIHSEKYDLIVVNYANSDMVGHTGDMAAAVKAVEAVDASLGRLAAALKDVGGVMFLTADHGNSELMRDPVTGAPHTAHTTNPVPALIFGIGDVSLLDGRLSDIAPTILELMELPKPAEMTGASLIERQASRRVCAS